MISDDAWGYWFAGFFDGEGCFGIRQHARTPVYKCNVQINLRADDLAILEEIRERTGVGTVSQLERVNTWLSNPTHKPQHRWYTQSKADAVEIVRIFDRYPLRAKKARDFAIWREAVAEWQTVQQSRQNRFHDWSRMEALQRELRRVRQFDESDTALRLPPERAHCQLELL